MLECLINRVTIQLINQLSLYIVYHAIFVCQYVDITLTIA